MTSVDSRNTIKHGAGFLISGLLATATDAGVLVGLTRGLDIDPFSSRLVAIGCAMIVGFFAHRRLTFAVQEPATLHQFARFVSVAATASAINYAIYAAILLQWPETEPLIAMLAPTIAAMMISYLGLRFAVFRKAR